MEPHHPCLPVAGVMAVADAVAPVGVVSGTVSSAAVIGERTNVGRCAPGGKFWGK